MAETFWKFSAALCKNDKVRELSAALSIPSFAAGALVALLYAWGTCKADDTGTINDFTEKAIEDACMWDGERGALVVALHNSGVLIGDLKGRSNSNPLRIADWEDIAEGVMKRRKDSRERKRKQRSKDGDVTQDVTRDGTQDVTRDGTQDVTAPRTKNEEQRTVEEENVFSASSAARPDFNTLEAYASSNLLTLSPGNMEELKAFKTDLPEELIRHAIDEACAAGKRSWGYTRSILYRYITDGVKNIAEARQQSQPKSTQQPAQKLRPHDRIVPDFDNLYA